MFQKFTPIQYLKIDIANSYGLDKLSWNKRLEWFDANEPDLASLIDKAKEPALFFAGIKAYYSALKGEPIGYMISLDATASGLQILSVMTGDRKAAELCNVVDTDDRRNAYEIVYDEMCYRIGDTSKISLDDAKQAIMTSLYGSTAVPKEVFGEGHLLKIFYETMKDLAPAAWELNEAFLDIWDDTAMENNWVMPDNFHVKIKVMSQVKQTVNFLNEPFDVFYNVNAPMSGGRSLGANVTHSIDGYIVREMTRRCDYDPKVVETLRDILDKGHSHGTRLSTEDDKMVIILWDHFKKTGNLSARIINHLNMDNIGHVRAKVISDLLDSFPDKPFKVISIHDCFRSLPHYGNDLRMQYNMQLENIAKSDMLTNIFCQILGREVKIGKLDPTLHRDVREANYALS